MSARQILWGLGVSGLGLLLAACGGSGGGNGSGAVGAATQYAQQCAPDNPWAVDAQGQMKPGYQTGTREREMRFVQAQLKEVYLWEDEMPEVDPLLARFQQGSYADGIGQYFAGLLSPARMPDGQLKDRFSQLLPTEEWQRRSQTGRYAGLGIDIATMRAQPPRDLRIALVQPDSAAAQAGLARGDRLIRVEPADGGAAIDVLATTDPAQLQQLNQLLLSATAGVSAVLVFQKSSGETVRTTLSTSHAVRAPVPASEVLTLADGSKLGYAMLDEFMLPLEGAMQQVFEQFRQAGVSDLVLDLRYNGGGYLYQAAQLAYMTAAPELSQGKPFEQTVYSSKRQALNTTLDFVSITSGRAGTSTRVGVALPNLGLKRVFVLSGPATCSASEALINGLRGIDVEVVQIGASTCGKPYGAVAYDNCGVSYLPVVFKGVNAKGEGDYVNGLAPTCTVAEDWTHPLGSPEEALLAAALHYRAQGQCPAEASGGGTTKSPADPSAQRGTGRLLRDPRVEVMVLEP